MWSPRPAGAISRFGRDRGGIAADIVAEALSAIAVECGDKCALDLAEKRKTAKHQTRIDLNETGSGADLAERASAGIDAARPDQREYALDPHIGFREHAVGQRQ